MLRSADRQVASDERCLIFIPWLATFQHVRREISAEVLSHEDRLSWRNQIYSVNIVFLPYKLLYCFTESGLYFRRVYRLLIIRSDF